MDCQFIMGFFSYMYYHSFIATYAPVTVGEVLETVITSLSQEQQLEVVQGLQKYLVGQGVVNEKVTSWYVVKMCTLMLTEILVLDS